MALGGPREGSDSPTRTRSQFEGPDARAIRHRTGIRTAEGTQTLVPQTGPPSGPFDRRVVQDCAILAVASKKGGEHLIAPVVAGSSPRPGGNCVPLWNFTVKISARDSRLLGRAVPLRGQSCSGPNCDAKNNLPPHPYTNRRAGLKHPIQTGPLSSPGGSQDALCSASVAADPGKGGSNRPCGHALLPTSRRRACAARTVPRRNLSTR